MTALKDIKKLEPGTIYAEIKSQPPLMRDEAGRRYVGREIEWLVPFTNGWESDGQAHLSFDAELRGIRTVKGTVSLAEYPWLKTLVAGAEVQVRGRILRVDTLTIELGDLELKLPKGKKSGVRRHSELRIPNSELRYQREK